MDLSRTKWRAGAAIGALALVALGTAFPAGPAAAETGGCEDRPHRAFSSDAAPRGAWGCWIDNGDKIRVCDNDPNDGKHAHADLWLDGGGFWLNIAAEDDGTDPGCDEASVGDLKGTANRLRLRVCTQNTAQQNSSCRETIWLEDE